MKRDVPTRSHLLVNLRIWIKVSAEVLHHLLHLLTFEVVKFVDFAGRTLKRFPKCCNTFFSSRKSSVTCLSKYG